MLSLMVNNLEQYFRVLPFNFQRSYFCFFCYSNILFQISHEPIKKQQTPIINLCITKTAFNVFQIKLHKKCLTMLIQNSQPNLNTCMKQSNFQFPIILCMPNFENRANFRLLVFGGYTLFGVWRTKNPTKLAWCPAVRQLVCQFVSLWRRYSFNKALKTSFRF